MNHMDAMEYENEYWPSLQCALHVLFTEVPGNKMHISYEKTYSCVYKCACNHYTSRLFKDLYSEVDSIMGQLSRELQDKEQVDLVNTFSAILRRFHCASEAVLLIFSYVCKMENHLEEELKSKLASMFTSQVVDQHLPRVIEILETAQRIPFLIPPELMSRVVLDLYALQPEYATVAPSLFAQFVPNLYPSLTVEELPSAIYQTKILQRQLLLSGYTSGETNSRKRPGIEEESQTKRINGSIFTSR